MKLKHLLTAAWALALVGCYNDTNEVWPEPTPVPLRVEAYVNDLQTRAGYETESLMEFGLYVDLNGEAANEDGWDNVQVSRIATDQPWTLSPQPYWPSSTATGTYYAYAPYADAVSDPANYSFSVQADQTTATNVTASDLLWTNGTGTGANEPLEVTLNHKLCKLRLTLKPAADLGENVEYTAVQLEGTLPSVAINLTSGTLTNATGTAQTIRMLENVDGTWECILIPQTISYAVRIFAIDGDEEKEYLYTATDPQEFASGMRYKLTLTVTPNDVAGGNFTADGWSSSEGGDLVAE